jgi:hypothetical protein
MMQSILVCFAAIVKQREQKRLLEEKQKRDRERQIMLNTKFDIYNSIEGFAAK